MQKPNWTARMVGAKNQNPVDFAFHPTFGTKRLTTFLSPPLAAGSDGRHFAAQKSGGLTELVKAELDSSDDWCERKVFGSKRSERIFRPSFKEVVRGVGTMSPPLFILSGFFSPAVRGGQKDGNKIKMQGISPCTPKRFRYSFKQLFHNLRPYKSQISLSHPFQAEIVQQKDNVHEYKENHDAVLEGQDLAEQFGDSQ